MLKIRDLVLRSGSELFGYPDLELNKGDTGVVVSGNGSGKSTLTRLFVREHEVVVHSGQIAFHDTNVSASNAADLGMRLLLQHRPMLPDTRVSQLLSLFGLSKGMLQELPGRVNERNRVSILSEGQWKLLYCNLILSDELSRILVLDEPFAALSEASQLLLFDSISSWQGRTQGTVLLLVLDSDRQRPVFDRLNADGVKIVGPIKKEERC